MVIVIKKIIDYLLSSKYRRRNLTVISSLILVLLILLINSSNAFYVDKNSFPFLNSIVGNFSSYDIVLRIYVEEDNTYELSNNIPDNNYVYDHYVCNNNSLLTYDNINKLINVIAVEKEECNVYFNLSGE